jgi:hypothetical protein
VSFRLLLQLIGVVQVINNVAGAILMNVSEQRALKAIHYERVI